MNQQGWFRTGLSKAKLVYLLPVILVVCAAVMVSVLEIFFDRDQWYHWLAMSLFWVGLFFGLSAVLKLGSHRLKRNVATDVARVSLLVLFVVAFGKMFF
jgi:hypothetical protein